MTVANTVRIIRRTPWNHRQRANLYNWPELQSQSQERLLMAINVTASILFTQENSNFNDTLTEALRIMGQSVDVDRVAIWKNYPENACIRISRTGCWNSKKLGEKSGDTVPGDFFIEEIFPYWDLILGKQMVLNYHNSDLKEPFRSLAINNDIHSVLTIPITSKGSYWGFICFSSCIEGRIYSSTEKKLLRSGGNLIAAAIDNNKEGLRLVRR